MKDPLILAAPIHYEQEDYDALYEQVTELLAEKPTALVMDLLNNLLVDAAMKSGNTDLVLDGVRAALEYKQS